MCINSVLYMITYCTNGYIEQRDTRKTQGECEMIKYIRVYSRTPLGLLITYRILIGYINFDFPALACS